jgi:monothiol glutaredoxin
MPRLILDEARIHPAIRSKVAHHGQAVLQEVQAALAAHKVVVVGMRANPFPRKARNALNAARIPHHYLEYGSYLSQWRTRLVLKMWTGWSTFPMVFVNGVLVGGYTDLQALIQTQELSAPE